MDLEAVLLHRLSSATLRLPPAPVVALKLASLLRDDRATLEELASVVQHDQVLTAVVLRLANSAAYARRSEVVQVSSAIVVLGRKTLHDLAWAQGLHEQSHVGGALLPLRRRAWREGLVSAQVAQWVAEVMQVEADGAFVAGLLHDIGRVPVIGVLEDLLIDRPEADTRTEDGWWSLVNGAHVQAGQLLAGRWSLPAVLTEVITSHHDLTRTSPLLEVVRVADEVVQLLDGAPMLEAARLGEIASLSTAQGEALAAKLPQLPTFLDAFREPSASGDGDVIDYELRIPSGLHDPVARVTIHADGLVHDVDVVAIDQRSLVVQQPLRAGQLVRVLVHGTSLHARVTGVDDGASSLAPWALDAAQQALWVEFVEAVSARVAA
jgi:HD-like signal output (HDOD) protein